MVCINCPNPNGLAGKALDCSEYCGGPQEVEVIDGELTIEFCGAVLAKVLEESFHQYSAGKLTDANNAYAKPAFVRIK